MSVVMVLALMLLPAVMYGLAVALDAARSWLGVTALPRARSVIRAGARRRFPISDC